MSVVKGTGIGAKATPGPTHPIVEAVLQSLSQGRAGVYAFLPAAVASLSDALGKLVGTPEFSTAVRDLALFAYMLEKKKGSKEAATAILKVTEAVAARVLVSGRQDEAAGLLRRLRP